MNYQEETNRLTTKLTQQLLKKIASRLASRDDCKGMEYVVHVEYDGPTCKIWMDDPVYVYPDRYSRKKENKQHIIEHVFKTYMHPNLYKGHADVEGVFLAEEVFVPGTYVYRKSVDSKRRSWTLA